MLMSNSRERLQLLHEALDKELAQHTGVPEQRMELHCSIDQKRPSFHPGQQRVLPLYPRQQSNQSGSKTSPVALSQSKRKEISELEMKLKQLERRIDTFSDSEDSLGVAIKRKLVKGVTQQIIGDQSRNRNYEGKKQRDSSEEDSVDYFAVSKGATRGKSQGKPTGILGRNLEERVNSQKTGHETGGFVKRRNYSRDSRTKQDEQRLPQQRVASLNVKERKQDVDLNVGENKEDGLHRVDNELKLKKGGVKCVQMKKVGVERKREGLQPRRDLNDSRMSLGRMSWKGSVKSTVDDRVRVRNLQNELEHYKRLANRLKDKVGRIKAMETEFRELKSNFAKSEQIREQQKKIIAALKQRLK